MYVGRLKARGQALMILDLDEAPPESAKKKIAAIPDVFTVKAIEF